MTSECCFKQGQILAAHGILQDSLNSDTECSLDDARLHHMIREEYKQLSHTQSRIKDVASWKRQYINTRARDSDDTVEIMHSTQKGTPRDFLVHVAIEDAVNEPFDILKHLDLCHHWIGCIIESVEIHAETPHLKIIRVSVANNLHSRLTPRRLFLKVLVFDNVNFDGAMGCAITHMNVQELEHILPRHIFSKYAVSIQNVAHSKYDSTVGDFRRVTFYFKDMQNRTVSGNKYSTAADHRLKCTILVENMSPNALFPCSVSTPLVSNYLYSSCIWWTSHAKQMSHSAGPLLHVQTRVHTQQLLHDKINAEKEAAAAKTLALEELAQRHALAVATNTSVNLIDF